VKIAQLAPISERVPPLKYGGTERVVYALTEELVKRGHDVTLFASGDSKTSARLESVYPRSLRQAKLKDPYGTNLWTMLNIGLAYDMQDEFDIIHDHLAPLSLPTANIATTPVLVTMHGTFRAENRRLFETLGAPYIATVSEAQVFPMPGINYVGTVHNGLPMEHYPFNHGGPSDYLLFVGRISLDKGVHLAIDAAQIVDMPLIIAAKIDDADRSYFREYIEPRLSDRVTWVGEVEEEERNELMMHARALLHPITWREPFGLVLIEALACGCPVIAFNHGSIPEIIKTGVTGFVVEDLEGMVGAIGALPQIDRAACREHALAAFSEKKMTDGYETIYNKILNKTS
jgi:glycosyltransferase involved in cell wall biosynthesis